MTKPKSRRKVRTPEVKQRYFPFDDSTRNKWIAQGKFPAPRYIGRTAFWEEWELDEWESQYVKDCLPEFESPDSPHSNLNSAT